MHAVPLHGLVCSPERLCGAHAKGRLARRASLVTEPVPCHGVYVAGVVGLSHTMPLLQSRQRRSWSPLALQCTQSRTSFDCLAISPPPPISTNSAGWGAG
jgi:hypothetical protein